MSQSILNIIMLTTDNQHSDTIEMTFGVRLKNKERWYMLRLVTISVCAFLWFTTSASAQTFTWEDFHPEVVQAFSGPYISWGSVPIDTGLVPSKQPTIVMGANQELFSESSQGHIFNSTDLGYTWGTSIGQSPSFAPAIPDGYNRILTMSTGLGVTNNNTLLMSWSHNYNSTGGPPFTYTDESWHREFWITRSTDRGQTWTPTALFDPSPYQIIADSMTTTQLSSGRLITPVRVQAQSRPGAPVSLSDNIFRSFVYYSDDDGMTWGNLSAFPDHGPESQILELPSGKLIASMRYQRSKLPSDPTDLAAPDILYNPALGDPTAIGQTVFQNTAITTSGDSGLTWSTPKLVTTSIGTTGDLSTLSDGTLILTFGRWGERFMLSYDEGATWSKAVFRLAGAGEYARSVVLDDDTIVSVHDSVDRDPNTPLSLGVRRWTAPSRSIVEQYGFFTPLDVETWSNEPAFPPGGFYEDFEAPDVVGSPSDPTTPPTPYWENVWVGGVYATPKIHAPDAGNATQYYDVDPVADGVSNGASQYWHFTTTDKPIITGELEFDIKGTDVEDGTPLSVRWRMLPGGAYDEIGIAFDLGQIKILDLNGTNDLLVGTWLEETWQHIWMSVDTTTQTVSVSLDGAPAVSTTYTPGLADLDVATIYFARPSVGASGFSLDNIRLVPEPVTLGFLAVGSVIILLKRRPELGG